MLNTPLVVVVVVVVVPSFTAGAMLLFVGCDRYWCLGEPLLLLEVDELDLATGGAADVEVLLLRLLLRGC